MAQKVGSAYYEMSMDASKFYRESKRMKAELKRQQTAYGMHSKAMKSLARNLFAGLSLGSIASGFKSISSEMDELAKTSRRMGITSEWLASLRHGAKLSGLEISTLDMAMQRMIRRVAEAGVGKGEAKDALKELGLDPIEMNARDPEVRLAAIAEAMLKVESSADKVRLAMKLFDSEGVAMLNMLEKGAKGIADFKREADKLGIAPDDEELRKFEEMNDSVERLSKSFGALAMKAAEFWAPILGGAADKLTGLATGGYADSAMKVHESGVTGDRKTAALAAAKATEMFKEMGQYDMASKSKAAMEFQTGSWLNELGGMTFKDGQKEIIELANQAARDYKIFIASKKRIQDKKIADEQKRLELEREQARQEFTKDLLVNEGMDISDVPAWMQKAVVSAGDFDKVKIQIDSYRELNKHVEDGLLAQEDMNRIIKHRLDMYDEEQRKLEKIKHAEEKREEVMEEADALREHMERSAEVHRDAILRENTEVRVGGIGGSSAGSDYQFLSDRLKSQEQHRANMTREKQLNEVNNLLRKQLKAIDADEKGKVDRLNLTIRGD